MFNMAVDGLRNEIYSLEAKLIKARSDLREVLKDCPHTKKEVIRESIPGGYLDKGSTGVWDECVVCRMRFNEVWTSNGYQ